MKISIKIVILLVLWVFSEAILYCQSQHDILLPHQNNNATDSYEIKISRWKDGALACVNVSFDDNNNSANRISKILDQYGYKGTFFFNSSLNLNIDSVTDIKNRLHEIGNHTFSHERFTSELDSTKIDFEIRKSKEMLENWFGIKCMSLAEPGHVKSLIGTKLIFKYHLFCRNYSEYEDVEQLRLPFSQLTVNQLSQNISTIIHNGTFLKLSGHGIDGDGYLPTPVSFLKQVLDTLKNYSDKNILWVTTLKEGSQYENLYYELELVKNMTGDTMTFSFNNYDRVKYKDFEESPISIEIPFNISSDLICLTNRTEVKKLNDRFILTTDLMRDSNIVVKFNNYNNYDSIKNDELFMLFPNPADDYINIVRKDNMSIELCNQSGQLISKINQDDTKVFVGDLPAGVYFIRAISLVGGRERSVCKKFVKK